MSQRFQNHALQVYVLVSDQVAPDEVNHLGPKSYGHQIRCRLSGKIRKVRGGVVGEVDTQHHEVEVDVHIT